MNTEELVPCRGISETAAESFLEESSIAERTDGKGKDDRLWCSTGIIRGTYYETLFYVLATLNDGAYSNAVTWTKKIVRTAAHTNRHGRVECTAVGSID
jgi:hypothetical protein